MSDIELKQLVMIDFLKDYIDDDSFKIKAEFSTNDNDAKVITVQEQTGEKIVFYGECEPLYNYYMIDIYGKSIQEEKNLSLLILQLIGTNNIVKKQVNGKTQTWQIMVKQFSNFQPIEYLDIRRVGYNATMQCIVNKIKED